MDGLRKFLSKFRILFWWIFIGYGFLLFMQICNIWVYHEVYDGPGWSWWGASLVIYFPLLIVVIIVCLFVKRKDIFAPLFVLALIISAFNFESLRALVVAIEFWSLNFQAATDVENYCHPVEFTQDGKTYRFGVCGYIWYNKDGQTDLGPDVVYDSSGDIANGTYNFSNPGQAFKPERKELVDVVRKFYNDDPEQTFENTDFEATSIYGNFYIVNFPDDEGGAGFTQTYGPPPYNKKNPYK